jgi:hypothetical protein
MTSAVHFEVFAMSTRKGVLLAGLIVLAVDGWAQQKAPPADQATQVRALRQQVTALRRQLGALRNEFAAENAARLEVLAQLNALKGQQAQLGALRQQIELLAREIKSLKANTVLDLNGYLTFDVSNGYPAALFRGINVQIVNGTGQTQTMNGLGNLIVGYNRPSAGSFICSLGAADTEAVCVTSGGVWAQSHKGGSHNIVGGDFNSYASWGGLVLGVENAISAPYAAVLSGARNRAGGGLVSISGGSYNTASGIYSTVSGGFDNRASGDFSAVAGGAQRTVPSSHDWAAGALFQDK